MLDHLNTFLQMPYLWTDLACCNYAIKLLRCAYLTWKCLQRQMFFCILSTSRMTPTKSSLLRLEMSSSSSLLDLGPGKIPSNEIVEKADNGEAKSSPRWGRVSRNPIWNFRPNILMSSSQSHKCSTIVNYWRTLHQFSSPIVLCNHWNL